MKSELECFPCPFCGKEAMVIRNVRIKRHDRYKVICPIARGGCGASSDWYPWEELAVKNWNRRV